MSDEFEIIDDDDQTLAIDEGDEFEVEEEAEDFDVDMADGEDAGSEEEIEDEDDTPVRTPKFRPDSNLYTVLLVFGFLAYAVALYFVLAEMQDYCEIDKFMWGMFKGQ